MDRRPLMSTYLVYLGVLVGGCSVSPAEGVFTCDEDSDCPHGWSCFTEGNGRCYSSPEAFPPWDTGSEPGETESFVDTDEAPGSDSSRSTADSGDDTAGQTDPGGDTSSGVDSAPSTGSGEAGDTGSDSLDTQSDSGSDPECTPAFSLRCGADGNVYWYDSCGSQGALVEECAKEHGVCVQPTDRVAACRCESGWVGPACNWDICERTPTQKQSCATAFGIGRNEMPAQFDGTTIDAIGALDVSCNGRGQPGKDVAFWIYLFAGETLEVSMMPEKRDLSLLLFAESLRSAGEPLCSETTLVTCSDNSQNAEETVVYEAKEDGAYFIVVDASVPFFLGAGDFSAEARIIDPKPGACYGG